MALARGQRNLLSNFGLNILLAIQKIVKKNSLVDYSIIIPAYNEQKYLGEVLDTLLSGMGKIPNYKGEIIVVDNNSSDRTAELAKAKGVRVVFESVNQISRARNAGGKISLGHNLLFVDADTHISKELLLLALQKLEYENCGGGGATIVFDSNQNQLFFGSFMPYFWSWISKTFKLAAGSFIFCKKQIFDEIDGFSEKLFAGEEILFSIMFKRVCKKKGLKFEILNDYPVVTSSRKLSWFNPVQILIAILIPLFFPWALRSRRLCSFWYKRPL